MSVKPIELVFKHVDGLDISMDVYIPDAARPDQPAPVMLWWHGGGLLQGTRKGLAPHMFAAPNKHNICIVSADYRLAPQTRLPGILSDCADAIRFLWTEEFAKATNSRVDPTSIVLNGSSAGGWLSLLCGTGIGFGACGLEPPFTLTKGSQGMLKGILAIYPITDLCDPFWKTVQRPVSYMDHIIQRSEVEPFVNPEVSKATFSALESQRAIFYHYMVQEAILSSLLLDTVNIPEDAFSVPQGIRHNPDSKLLPPVYLVTGNQDGKVPHRQSLDVLRALQERGSKVEYEELDGLDHGFDREEGREMERMYEFAKAVLRV